MPANLPSVGGVVAGGGSFSFLLVLCLVAVGVNYCRVVPLVVVLLVRR